MFETQVQLSRSPSIRERRSSLADRDAALVRTNVIAFVLLTLFVALAPFPYGAVTPRATFVLVGSAFIIGALAFFSGPTRRLGGLLIPCSALIVVAVIGAIQLAPTSIGTLRKIAPVSAEVYAGANRILSMFERRAVQPRISIAPDDTLVTILLALAFAALIAASSLLATTRMRRRVLIGALLASSAIHVLYATATTQASTRVHGTFINPNHFAGYLEIALAFSFAVIWRELLHNRERAAGVRDLADRVEKRIPALIATILLWCVIAAGIALTRSRGGILAALEPIVEHAVDIVRGAATDHSAGAPR